MPYIVLDPTTAQAAPVTTAGNPLTSVGETLASFQANLLEDLQGRTDVSATRTKRWVNKGYRRLASMVDVKELNSSLGLTLVADQPFYLLPTAVAWIKRIVVEDPDNYYYRGGDEWEMIDEMTYRNLPDSDEIEDLLPSSYFRYGRMVVVYPTPTLTNEAGDVAAMDFRVRVADLANPTDSPILPVEFHETIYLFALAEAQRRLGMRSEGDRTFNDAVSSLRTIINTDAEEADAMHMVMQPTRERSQLYRSR